MPAPVLAAAFLATTTVEAGTGAVLGAAALLLLAAGAAKVADPTRTVGALRVLGWPVGAGADIAVVRAAAAGEALVGAATLVVGGRVLAGLVALSYAAFAGFVALALRRHAPIGSCGCFGQADTPPRPGHVAIDVVLAAGALAAAVAGGRAADPLVDLPAAALAAAVVLAAAAYLGLTRPRAPV